VCFANCGLLLGLAFKRLSDGLRNGANGGSSCGVAAIRLSDVVGPRALSSRRLKGSASCL
jgi:hypothetical protein